MKKAKKIFSLVIVLIIVGLTIFILFPKSGSFDSFIFKGINKTNTSQIRINEIHSIEGKKIEDKEQVRFILSELGKINIKESNENFPEKGTKIFDIDLSNGNNYISFENAKEISDVQITYYDTGYINLQGEGTLKNKFYKITAQSDVKYVNGIFENLV